MNYSLKNLIPLEIDGTGYSAIPTGLSSKLFRTMDIGSIQAEPGWFFDDNGRVEPWNMIGVRENENGMLFYGPAVKGHPLVPEALSPEELAKLVAVFQSLREKHIPYEGFFVRAWFFCDDGRLLLLPPTLMNHVRKCSPEAVRTAHWHPYNHPDLSACDGLEFSTAVLACLALKAPHPYAPLEQEEDNRNEQLRIPPLLPPEVLIPGLTESWSELISESLKKEGEANLKDWIKVLSSMKDESPVKPLNEEEKAELEKRAEELKNKGEKNRKFRQNWRRKNSIYLGAAIVAVVLVLFLSAPVKKALEPPLTMGMSAREVVESYYGGFNTLNQEIMEDAIAKDLGKGDIEEVTNFYVTSRVRQGYEGNSGIVSAGQWVEEGRPALEAGVHLYGTAGLGIEEMGGAKYRVSYEKWMPGHSEETDPPAGTVIPPRGYEITDLLTLEEQKKGNWLIIGLDRTVREIPAP